MSQNKIKLFLTNAINNASASFDYIEYGANETYALSFRVVRFKFSEDSYACLVTNLPEYLMRKT